MKIANMSIPQKMGHWRILAKIGEGSFGCIYKAEQTKLQSQKSRDNRVVAIKTQLITNVKQMLLLEYQIYKQFEGQVGFPKTYQYEQEQIFSYMALELLQISLDKYAANRFPKQFAPVNVVLQIMIQTLTIIKKIHSKGYLYRDMKPSNLMLKQPYQEIIIIDFGLCKKYIVNGRHIAQKQNKKMVGTPLFCSLNTHAGIQQSRRDDLESWLWTCLFFSLELPWECVLSKRQLNKQAQCQQIYKIKKQVKWETYLNQSAKQKNIQIPKCCLKIIAYIQKLQFEEEPNYKYLEDLIKDEYFSLYESQLPALKIDWESKIPLSNVIMNDKSKLKQQEKTSHNESPKKVRKINFKIPIKAKISQTLISQEKE